MKSFLVLSSLFHVQIPISCVVLDRSYATASQNELSLDCGLHVPILSSVVKLEIRTEKGHQLSEEEVTEILAYGDKCLKLKMISLVL